jgi:hypothetical protein
LVAAAEHADHEIRDGAEHGGGVLGGAVKPPILRTSAGFGHRSNVTGD